MNVEDDIRALAAPWMVAVDKSVPHVAVPIPDRPSFLTAVFWWTTLQSLWRDPDPASRTPQVALPPLHAVDFDTQTLFHAALPKTSTIADLPLVFQEVHKVLTAHGTHHNDLGTHTVFAVGATRFVTGWQCATFTSMCVPLPNVRTTCMFHRLGACHMSHLQDMRCCNTAMTPDGPCRLPTRRVALALRGMFCGKLKPGLHATTGSQPQNVAFVDPFLPPVVGALKATLEVCDAAGVTVDVFAHGWYGTDADLATCNAWATKGPFASRVKATKFEPLSRSFRRQFQPYVAKGESTTDVDESLRHLTATPTNLQRWWSTLHSVKAAYGLVEASGETYDVVIVQRSDLVTPPCLNIPGLDPDRLTVLCKQKAYGTSPDRVGLHDWWVAGPPSHMKRYAGLASVFPFVFSKPLRARSIHQVFQNAMETAGVPVVCLHMTMIVKAMLELGDDGSKNPRLKAVFSNCRRRDCFDLPLQAPGAADANCSGSGSGSGSGGSGSGGAGTASTSTSNTTHLKIELHEGRLPWTVVAEWLVSHSDVVKSQRTGIVTQTIDGVETPVGVRLEADVRGTATVELPVAAKRVLSQLVVWTRKVTKDQSHPPTIMVMVDDNPVPMRIVTDGCGKALG